MKNLHFFKKESFSKLFRQFKTKNSQSNFEFKSLSPDLKIKFSLDGFYDYEGEFDEINFWEKHTFSNGDNKYTLFAVVDRDVKTDERKKSTAVLFGLSFITSENLKAGQVYDITKIDIKGHFPLNNESLNPSIVHNNLTIKIDQNTSGRLKITAVNKNRISGEFHLNNLLNEYYKAFISNTKSKINSKISELTIPSHINISNGHFYGIEII